LSKILLHVDIRVGLVVEIKVCVVLGCSLAPRPQEKQ